MLELSWENFLDWKVCCWGGSRHSVKLMHLLSINDDWYLGMTRFVSKLAVVYDFSFSNQWEVPIGYHLSSLRARYFDISLTCPLGSVSESNPRLSEHMDREVLSRLSWQYCFLYGRISRPPQARLPGGTCCSIRRLPSSFRVNGVVLSRHSLSTDIEGRNRALPCSSLFSVEPINIWQQLEVSCPLAFCFSGDKSSCLHLFSFLFLFDGNVWIPSI